MIKKERGQKRKVTDEEIADALIRAQGLVTFATKLICKARSEEAGEPFSISQQAVSKRISESPGLKAVLDECDKAVLDMAEGKLLKLINEGNLSAIIFYLKCKGKGRGYVERQELTGRDGGPLQAQVETKIDLSKMTDEELRVLAGAAKRMA